MGRVICLRDHRRDQNTRNRHRGEFHKTAVSLNDEACSILGAHDVMAIEDFLQLQNIIFLEFATRPLLLTSNAVCEGAATVWHADTTEGRQHIRRWRRSNTKRQNHEGGESSRRNFQPSMQRPCEGYPNDKDACIPRHFTVAQLRQVVA